jgi:predicted nucleic acid-binding protein
MDAVYVETTVIGNIAGKLQANPANLARQNASRTWWAIAPSRYRLVVSEVVVEECKGGDPSAAAERMAVIEGLEVLAITEPVRELVKSLLANGAVPTTEPRDAFHIAIAAVSGVQYLVTWNFKHIANASLRTRIEGVCRSLKFEPPVICTPEEIGD